MGRHRRLESDPPPWTPDPDGPRRRGGHRRRRLVRTGVLSAAALLAAGGVAVGAGVASHPQNPFSIGEDAGDRTRAAGSEDIAVPDYFSPSPSASERSTPSVSRSGSHDARSASPSTSRSPSASKSATPTKSESPKAAAPSPSASTPTEAPTSATPSERPTSSSPSSTPSATPTSATPSEEPTSASPTSTAAPANPNSAQENEVLELVNQERAEAGCQPVTADPDLGDLAGDFSLDMAERDFFDHTDPDGNDPWDRARARGIDNLGAENIARGQSSAQAVMDSWMQSSGHRANILNCEFRTLGVGAHIADGGPWWTQEFGY